MAIAVSWILYEESTGTPVKNPDAPFLDLSSYLPNATYDGITGIQKKFYIGLAFQGTSVYNIKVWLDGNEVDAYEPTFSTDPVALRATISNYCTVYATVVNPALVGTSYDLSANPVTTWNTIGQDEGTALSLGDAYLTSSFIAYSSRFALGVLTGSLPINPLTGLSTNIDLVNFRLLASFSTTDVNSLVITSSSGSSSSSKSSSSSISS